MKSPIRELLVLTIQSSSCNLIYFAYRCSTELKKQTYTKYIRNKMQKHKFPDIDFSSFIFKVNHAFIEEDSPSEKVVVYEEELDGIDIDDTWNLEDLPRAVFIN